MPVEAFDGDPATHIPEDYDVVVSQASTVMFVAMIDFGCRAAFKTCRSPNLSITDTWQLFNGLRVWFRSMLPTDPKTQTLYGESPRSRLGLAPYDIAFTAWNFAEDLPEVSRMGVTPLINVARGKERLAATFIHVAGAGHRIRIGCRLSVDPIESLSWAMRCDDRHGVPASSRERRRSR